MGDSGFLGALANQLSSQFSLGDNTNHTLDSIDLESGKNVKYGSLGEFASQFDQSSERRYVEDGFLRTDPFTTDPKQFEILMQEPNATVLLKKRMFSSVADNFRLDFMDDDEKIYYKSMKVLFQNKCNQISALEKLSKIQKITDSVGNVSEQLMPIIFSLSDSITSGFNSGSSNAWGANSTLQGAASKLTNTIDSLRRVYGFNHTNATTSWITDDTNLYQSQFGQGTGVIEITNFTNLKTTTSTDLGAGGFSISISDPYEAMLITEYDIEKAISDATNMFYNSKINQFAKESAASLINDITVRLNQSRVMRGASPISIKLNPDTILGKRVTAIIDRLGIELPFEYDSTSALTAGLAGDGATVPPEYLKGGAIAGNDGLSTDNIKFQASGVKRMDPGSEVKLFSRLISTIYSKLTQDANSQGAFTFNNEKTNYARKKLRFNFSGKLIIQPMDTVHIFMGSKSRFDTKLLSGLKSMFSGVGMFQNMNNTLTNLKSSIDTLFNPSGSVPFQIEKSAFVGADFPNPLWSLVRGQFVSEKEGAHVFAGVVESASSDWSAGKYTISVSGKDNSYFFEQGQVNLKPSMDNFNGTFFDPLTPFKSNFDVITPAVGAGIPELLDQNKYLLGSDDGKGNLRKSLVKSKLGRYAGSPVNEKDVINDRNVDPSTGRITNVFYAPDGLVYKWKEGIGVFTQHSADDQMDDANRTGNVNIAKEPFAGQDIMNVLSLLITGQPYNYSNYYNSSKDIDAGFAEPLRNDLAKNNTLWGNFVPFKNLVLDEASYIKSKEIQSNITGISNDIAEKTKKLNDLNTAAMQQGAVNILSPAENTTSKFVELQAQSRSIRDSITFSYNDMDKEIDGFYSQGSDASAAFDSTDFMDPSQKNKAISDDRIRKLVRRQLNFLTRRMSYDVRANADKNLFIVDDTYDKDYDILAFEKSLTKLEQFNDEFTSVKEKIKLVAQMLNFEVFCDSQGHIRVRSPQYNRMPSSVYYKMMYLKDTLKIQIFPKFLDDLFKNKLDTLKSRIEILEDQIRLDCAILSYNTDYNAAQFIKFYGGNFAFISDEGDASHSYENGGTITNVGDLISAANPDSKASVQVKDIFSKIKDANMSNKIAFSNTSKYNAFVKVLTDENLNASGSSTPNAIPIPVFLNSNSRVDTLVKRIQSKSGQRVDKNDYLIKKDDGTIDVQITTTNIRIDNFKVINELTEKINDHQKAVKTFYNTIKNAQEFKYLDDKESNTNGLLTPGTYGKSHIPEVFEHMIEDESYDDYGVGSGSRYIIRRSQIIRLNIAENPPTATMVEVSGITDEFNTPTGALVNAVSNTGNKAVKALAVDYDMWRNYGFRGRTPIQVSFLNDSDTQCAPYAAMILSRNRKNILRGSVTISGNEFMQPGEVVYIEDRALLFYVSSVEHSFTFGTSFQTTLHLTYGHTPGEYIPTPMDMVGKMLYNNKDIGNRAVERQDSAIKGNGVNIGVLQLNKTSEDDGGVKSSLGLGLKKTDKLNAVAAENSKVINYIIYTTAYLLNQNQNQGADKVARIELRTYYDNDSSLDKIVLDFAQKISEILVNPGLVGVNQVMVTKQGTSAKSMDKTSVKDPYDTTVNLDDKNNPNSPSQKAISAARDISASKSAYYKSISDTSNKTDNKLSNNEAVSANIKLQQDSIRIALFHNIVDCWLILEDAAATNSPTGSSNGGSC